MDIIFLIFLYFSIFFIIGTLIKNNSIVDIGWGIGFVIISWYVFFKSVSVSLPQILITIFVSIWGLRLFIIFLKEMFLKLRILDMQAGESKGVNG